MKLLSLIYCLPSYTLTSIACYFKGLKDLYTDKPTAYTLCSTFVSGVSMSEARRGLTKYRTAVDSLVKELNKNA